MGTSNNQQDSSLKAKEWMVKTQIEARGIHNPLVLKALHTVPRHLFVPPELRNNAYEDRPLPIGYQQTISQPYIVAFMSEAINAQPTDRVLEIGTGCGYQAAILSRICHEVFTIEIVEPLAQQAQKTLTELGYSNIHTKIGDGYEGWPEAAPFDAIIVTAASPKIPPALINQLKMGGRLIMPVGEHLSNQSLIKITKTPNGLLEDHLMPVRFVPLTGKAED